MHVRRPYARVRGPVPAALLAALSLLTVITVSGCALAVGSEPGPAGTSPGSMMTASGGPWTCTGPATARTDPGSLAPVDPGSESALPVTVTDHSGEQVTVTDTSRILALDTYGTLGSTVYALGLGDRMVGRDVSTGVPALADLPVVTHNGHELNAEAILALDPSVVLTDYSIGPLEVQLQLRDAGIPVVIMDDSRSRDTVVPQIEEVAQILGVPEAGARLGERVAADIDAAETEIAARAPADPAQRPRMVFLYLRGTAGVYYWFGKGSGADDLITSLGGVDVATESGLAGEQPLTAEGLIKADPDLYLMMTHGLASVGGVSGVEAIPGVADTTAGQTRCIVDMSDYEILSFGPQYPATLRALAAAVYGSGT